MNEINITCLYVSCLNQIDINKHVYNVKYICVVCLAFIEMCQWETRNNHSVQVKDYVHYVCVKYIFFSLAIGPLILTVRKKEEFVEL